MNQADLSSPQSLYLIACTPLSFPAVHPVVRPNLNTSFGTFKIVEEKFLGPIHIACLPSSNEDVGSKGRRLGKL